MDIQTKLINQAENLFLILLRLNPVNGSKMFRVMERAYLRYERRWVNKEILKPCGVISSHIKNLPGGFASPPVLLSGVVGQGATIDGSFYECDCSECTRLTCQGCDQ